MNRQRKLLVEQAWSLRMGLDRNIDIERKRSTPAYSPQQKIERLNSVLDRASSRYLRRLKQYWA